MKRTMIALCVAAALSGGTATQIFAQGVERSEAIASSDALSQISTYSYRDGPKSDLLFRGTPLAATAEGKAQVEYQNDNAQISAEVQDLPEPASLGPYTTYVLWAVTPDGRASNKGVIGGIEGGKGELETQHNASQFALIVTAEPHFAVTIPSTMMVLYNVGDDVKGTESKVTKLTERVDYAGLGGSRRMTVDDNNPLEIVQARYAVEIARTAGADKFGSDAFVTANQKLAAAEQALAGKKSSERNTAPGLAREAVIAGEDARRAALLASNENAATERQRAAAAAATNTANEAARIAAAETAAVTAAATASAATAAAAENEAARVAAVTTAAATEAAIAAAATEAAAASQAASEAAAQVERERATVAARDELRGRLNEALPTRDSSRGLIAEIGGVQFSTGTADVNAAAREGLAKFSGIVASYPDLRFNVEGHTDNMGSAAMNQELSLKRAMTVRDYLISQGVPASRIDVAGLGLSAPIGDNTTTDGRARNRRVEIVVSGGPLIAANL
jgi:outer membrane protein OmpA-like peptidoglycan-associated protein